MYGCFADFHIHSSKNCKGYMKNHEHRKLQWTFAYKNPLSISWATKMPARKHDFCGTIPPADTNKISELKLLKNV
jgi:16S rRNA C1402 (ribose-2'-O) methylase RsmI